MKVRKQAVEWQGEKAVLRLLEQASLPFLGQAAIRSLRDLWCYHHGLMTPLLEQACSSKMTDIRIGTALFFEKEVSYFKCGICPGEEKTWFKVCIKTLKADSDKRVRQIAKRMMRPKDVSLVLKV